MNSEKEGSLSISRQSLQRLPLYLELLKKLKRAGDTNVSSSLIAGTLSLHPVQVRKDLASVSTVEGNPRIGFSLDGLISDIEDFLGFNNVNEAVLVGVGNLGRALMSYKTFEDCGLRIIAGFDSNPDLIGTTVHGKDILDVSKLSELCDRIKVHIGIITVPAPHAQWVCDRLVEGGIEAVWNFAPTHLIVPDNVILDNENLSASFAGLSTRLRMKKELKKFSAMI